jgi:hypothetical protein
MKIPALDGLIRRRLLINYRVDPDVIKRLLPAPFQPKRQRDYAIAGICLIRLEQVRPAGVPAALGIASENAAHRIAVEWRTAQGETREGVFVPRRDTGSTLNHLAAGRIFPGTNHLAHFSVTDDLHAVNFMMDSKDGSTFVRVRGAEADLLPPTSCFASLAESSRFFENGCIGYSPSGRGDACVGLRLEVAHWTARAFAASHVESSWFSDLNRKFPGAAEFDHALVMRDIPHRWHAMEEAP